MKNLYAQLNEKLKKNKEIIFPLANSTFSGLFVGVSFLIFNYLSKEEIITNLMNAIIIVIFYLIVYYFIGYWIILGFDKNQFKEYNLNFLISILTSVYFLLIFIFNFDWFWLVLITFDLGIIFFIICFSLILNSNKK